MLSNCPFVAVQIFFNITAVLLAAILHWTLRGREHERTVETGAMSKVIWGMATFINNYFSMTLGMPLFHMFKGTIFMVWYLRSVGHPQLPPPHLHCPHER